ncbi:MAG: ParB/RepB/Spo0J family partition protein [Actinomycetota bacterium]
MTTRRSGLGRGLDALLPSADAVGSPEDRSPLRGLPPDAIAPNPNQPRARFDDASIDELAASLKQVGMLQPVLVREVDTGRYELVAGERRLRAAKVAGLARVPALVVDVDDRGSLERAIVENLHREDLNPMEEAAAYRQLMDEGGFTHEALAERLGRNRVTITTTLRLLDLPLEIQSLIAERALSAAHGRALLALQGNPFQKRLAQRAAAEGWSARATADQVTRYQSFVPATGDRAPPRERPAAALEAQYLLARHLQTRVRVEMGKRKGKIVLDFASLDELARLTAAITGGDTAENGAGAS